MNERIRELAEQAHCYACEYAQQPDYNPHNPYNQGMYKQRYDRKFAELIVRECLTKIENEAAQYHEPVWAFELVNDIKDHFGVEE